MSGEHPLVAARRDAIVRLYTEEHQTVPQIADTLGVRRSLVEKDIERRHCRLPDAERSRRFSRINKGRYAPTIDLDRAAALYATGLSLGRVGACLGVSFMTIRKHLLRRGIVLRGPREAALTRNMPITSEVA